jgi:hypothetical protein
MAGQLWCAVANRTAYAAIAVLFFSTVSYLLLKGVRWAWVTMVLLASLSFGLWLLAWWVVPALVYLIPLTLLLAPPTRRHFARERSGSPEASSESRMSRIMASPIALRAFAVALVVFAVGPLIPANVDRLDEKPVRAVLVIAFATALWGSIGYFVVRGARFAWLISIALMCAIAAATITAGIWPVAVVPIVLLLLLLLPGSVAFVWRDRRRIA